ncbi:transcription initiation factor TFIID subunit 1 isoform X1 [Tanacetum coccineum]
MAQFPLLTTTDKADIVDRVFEMKIHQFINFLRDAQPFGKTVGGLLKVLSTWFIDGYIRKLRKHEAIREVEGMMTRRMLKSSMQEQQVQSCLERNMYRALVYPHKVLSTDYLLIRSAKGKLSLRRIDLIYAVGQEEPHMEVMSAAVLFVVESLRDGGFASHYGSYSKSWEQIQGEEKLGGEVHVPDNVKMINVKSRSALRLDKFKGLLAWKIRSKH